MKYLTLLIVCVSLFLLSSCWGKTDSENKKPNILFILVDDLGWSDLGYAGSTFYETPNMDKSLDQDIWPENINVCPTCPPTRAEPMTGRYNHRVGVWYIFPGRGRIHKSELTIVNAYTNSVYST